MNDFCEHASIYPVVGHANTVDYTHHFSMNYLSNIDHLIVSEQLFQSAVVIRDVNNTSDHDPVCLKACPHWRIRRQSPFSVTVWTGFTLEGDVTRIKPSKRH